MSKTNVYLAFTDRATTPNSVHRAGSRPEMSQYAYRNSDTSGSQSFTSMFNGLDSGCKLIVIDPMANWWKPLHLQFSEYELGVRGDTPAITKESKKRGNLWDCHVNVYNFLKIQLYHCFIASSLVLHCIDPTETWWLLFNTDSSHKFETGG